MAAGTTRLGTAGSPPSSTSPHTTTNPHRADWAAANRAGNSESVNVAGCRSRSHALEQECGHEHPGGERP